MLGEASARLLHAFILLSVIGCTVGPAANRAGEVEPERGQPSPVPEVPDAPAQGGLSVSATFATGIADACCLAELPSGDLLIGTRESGTIHRLDTVTGEVSEVGTLSGVAYADERELLALAVEPGSAREDVFAYYTDGEGATIARYGYEGDELAYSAWTFVEGVPATDVAVLAFGPDGMLYAGTATGDVLRMTALGWEPEVVGAFGGVVTGLAWDGAGRLCVVAGGVVTVGGAALHTWPPSELATGLASVPASGSLWVGGGGGLWRVPLDGQAAELFPLVGRSPVAVVGAWVLTAGGDVAKVTVR